MKEIVLYKFLPTKGLAAAIVIGVSLIAGTGVFAPVATSASQDKEGARHPHHRKKHHAAPKHHEDSAVSGDPIAAFVAEIQPKKGPRFARRVARAIRRSAKKTGLSPEVLLATGYVESEFRTGAGPCKGVMQVHLPTLREMRRHMPAARNLDPDRIEDNIQIGALELASYYTPLASRKRELHGSKTERLCRAWGRYNGSSSHGRYVRRVRAVLRRIQTGNVAVWHKHLERYGPLWNSEGDKS